MPVKKTTYKGSGVRGIVSGSPNPGNVLGSVEVSNTVEVTGPLTNSQLRALAVQVIANAGTNLNTSLLALESGNLASIKAVTDQLDFDITSGRLILIDHIHSKIHEGKNFFVQDWQDVTGAGTNFDIRINTPVSGHMHFAMHFHTEDEFTVILYEGATLSGGTAKTILNSNRNSATTSGATITYGPTVTATGTQIKTWKSGSGTGNQGESSKANERILKQNTQYLLRFNRIISGTGYVDFEFDWYEV